MIVMTLRIILRETFENQMDKIMVLPQDVNDLFALQVRLNTYYKMGCLQLLAKH